MSCPGSVFLSQGLEDKKTIYAAEGTVAHAICEELLKNRIGSCEAFIGSRISEKHSRVTRNAQVVAKENYVNSMLDQDIEQDGFTITVTSEMLDHCYMYANTVIADCIDCGLNPHVDLNVEYGFQLKSVDNDAYGTCDAWFRTDTTIHVYDFKYGAGKVVEATNNPQLMYYALGAGEGLKIEKLKSISLVIIQPRAVHSEGIVRRWNPTITQMIDFKAELTKAIAATRQVTDKNLMENLNVGSQCRWCRAKTICPEAKAKAMDDLHKEFSMVPSKVVRELTPQMIAEILDKKDQIIDWLNDFEKQAYISAESGVTIPGYKLVEKFGNRAWKDEQSTIDILSLSEDEEALYTKKLVSVAQAEKLFGQLAIDGLWEKPSRGKVLVKESSAKKAIAANRKDAVEDFKNVEVEHEF